MSEISEIQFDRVKETKNTVKFEEVVVPGKPPHVGTLYIQKWVVGDAKSVLVTIKPKTD